MGEVGVLMINDRVMTTKGRDKLASDSRRDSDIKGSRLLIKMFFMYMSDYL